MSARKHSKSIKDPLDKYPLIAQRLRSLRIDHHLTQDQLGEMLGLTGQAVSSYENAKVLPSLPALMKYHAYFGADLNYLTGDTEGEDETSKFIMSATETQIIKGYRRRPEYMKKVIRSLCYGGTSFRSCEEEISDLEEEIDHLKKEDN